MFDLLIRLLENSAVMSVAILLMYGLSRLTRDKTSPQVRYICWVVIGLGLLLPLRPALFTVELPVSMPIPMQAVNMMQPPVGNTGAETYSLWQTANLAETAYAYHRPAAQLGMAHTANPAPHEAAAMPTSTQAIPLRAWLLALWGAGAAVFLLFCALRHRRFTKKINRWAHPAAAPHISALLQAVCREVNLHSVPNILICPLTATPVMTGLLRPALILPDENIEPQRLYLMLLHETLHVKRRDIWVRALMLLVAAVHWFNPLVHLMSRRMQTEAELACDAAVLRHAGDGARAEYGQAVFTTAKAAHRLQGVLASALSGEGKNLKRRLSGIVEKKRTRRGLAIFCAALMIGAVLLAASLSYEGRHDEGDTPTDGVYGAAHDGDPTAYDAPTAVLEPLAIENTNELIIYVPGAQDMNRLVMNAIGRFRRQNPDVNVIVETVGTRDDWAHEAYTQRVGVELMAGRGPDIILANLFDDPHSLMRNGMLMDLSYFWDNDGDFTHRGDLNATVMNAGVYRGRRYVAPLTFDAPILLTERGALESVGFDPDGDMNVIAFYNALGDAMPAAQGNPLFRIATNMFFAYLSQGFSTGIPLVDFAGRAALPDADAIRGFSEAYQPFWGQFIDWEDPIWQRTNVETMLTRGTQLFHHHLQDPISQLFGYSRLTQLGYAPMFTAILNHQGELHATVTQSAAIRAGTPNYANAWDFIKVLLEENTQYARIGSMENFGLGFVVNNRAFERQVDEVLQTNMDVGTPEGSIRHQALTAAQKQPFVDLVQSISAASLPNRTLGAIYMDAMDPFMQGRQSLDDAMEELARRLWFYLSE